MEIRQIQLNDEPFLARFSCGDKESEKELNEFLAHDALDYHRKHLMSVWVAVEADGSISGYYGIYCGALRPPRDFLKEFPHKPPSLPAITLGKLAVSRDQRNRGLGIELMYHALANTAVIAESLGVTVIKLEAYEEPATFYELKFKFLYASRHPKWESPTDVEVMYLPMAMIIGDQT